MSKQAKVPGTSGGKQAVMLRQVQLPLEGVPINVHDAPPGAPSDKQIVLGPFAMTLIIPLGEQGAEEISRALSGSKIVIARPGPGIPV